MIRTQSSIAECLRCLDYERNKIVMGCRCGLRRPYQHRNNMASHSTSTNSELLKVRTHTLHR